MADGLDSEPTNRSFGEEPIWGRQRQLVRGLERLELVGPVVVKGRAASGAKRGVEPGRRLRWFADDRSAGSAASAVNFNAPVVLRTDRARAKTRKQDTTRPRNRFLLGADSQLCHR